MPKISAFGNNIFDFPVYGLPFVVVFPILDNTGEPVADAADLAAIVSLNGDTFGASANPPSQIPTSSGLYYLELSDVETEAEVVAIKVTTSTADAKSTCLTVYPKKISMIDSGQTWAVSNLYRVGAGHSEKPGFYIGAILHLSTSLPLFEGETRLITDYVVDDPVYECNVITVAPLLDEIAPIGVEYQIYALSANTGGPSPVGGIAIAEAIAEASAIAIANSSAVATAIATAIADSEAVAEAVATAIANAILEGDLTWAKTLRIMLSVLAGKSSGGGGNNLRFRDLQDVKDRVNEIVDNHGNRTTVILDGD